MKTILIQLDTDAQPSVFDRVVAVDAGVDEIFSYGGMSAESVEGLVHGAMFTRGPTELKHTAIFIGGSKVEAAEALMSRVSGTFFGPCRVSVMMDANGCNTTAAAAVLAVHRHVQVRGAQVVVLGGTGPVGQRVAMLLALQGASVVIASRNRDRAEETGAAIRHRVHEARVVGCESTASALRQHCQNMQVLVAAGAAGVQFLKESEWREFQHLKLAIDANAVAPAGLEGIAAGDKAKEKEGIVCYGALGIGGMKMKVHRECVRKLFSSNDLLLDCATIYEIAEGVK